MLVVEIFFQMTCHLVAGMTSVYPTCPSSEFVFEMCKLLSPAGFLKLSLGDLWAPVFRGCFGHFALSGYSCIYCSFPQQSGGCDRVAIPKIWGSSWLSQHVWSSCLSVSVRKLELKSPSLKRSDAIGCKKFCVFWNDPTNPFLFLVLCIPYKLACPVVDNQHITKWCSSQEPFVPKLAF